MQQYVTCPSQYSIVVVYLTEQLSEQQLSGIFFYCIFTEHPVACFKHSATLGRDCSSLTGSTQGSMSLDHTPSLSHKGCH